MGVAVRIKQRFRRFNSHPARRAGDGLMNDANGWTKEFQFASRSESG